MNKLLPSIEVKKKKLDSFRPFPASIIKNLEDWFRVELTYTSNAIEGNTLSRRETAMIVSEGLTVEGKTIIEHLEAQNHARALDLILAGTAEISKETIFTIHKTILQGIDDENAGRLRTVGVRIAGSQAIMPSAGKVFPMMDEFYKWLNKPKNLNPVFFAAMAHFKLVSIHPFVDGNGRTARLLMDLILIKNHYPPALITKEERKIYLDAVEKAQITGDTTDYLELIYLAVDRSLDVYLETLGEAPEEELLTVMQAAKLLQVHPESVRRWVRQHKLPAVKISHKFIRIKKQDLTHFML